MRILTLFLSLVILFSCNSAETAVKIDREADSLYFSAKFEAQKDSLVADFIRQTKGCTYQLKQYKDKADTLKVKLFLSEYKVEKVRYYLNICLRNSSQDVFLKGWIRRALDD